MKHKRKWILAAVLVAVIVGAAITWSLPSVTEWRLRQNVINADSPDKKICAVVELLKCYQANGHLQEINRDNCTKKLGIDPAKTVWHDPNQLSPLCLPAFGLLGDKDIPMPAWLPSIYDEVDYNPGAGGGMIRLQFSMDNGCLECWTEIPEIKLLF